MATRRNAASTPAQSAPRRSSKPKARAKKPAKGGGGFPFLKVFLVLGALAVVAGLATAAVGYVWFSRELPSIERVEDYRPKQVTRVMDRDGNVIASWTDDERLVRTVVTEEEMAPLLRAAFVAAEDSNFYEHKGLDYVGLLRAIYTNVRRGQLSQGASTITQQVVKNLLLSPERSFRRKIQEALLAFELDRNLEKDEILTIYLNEVFFGVHFYGVEEASLYYFGRSAKDLELHQAALLAGLVQSPNRYNPFRHPDRALERRRYVLRRMYEEGMVEEGVYREALELPLDLAEASERRPYEGQFSYYTDAVRRELLQHFDESLLDTGGLRIYTALELQTQQGTERAVQAGLRAFDARHGFHTPYRRLTSEEEVARFRREQAGDIEREGLRTTKDYRGVIVRSDDDATIMAIGDWLVTLDRSPASRLRPSSDKAWAEYFPVNAVFTVRPVGDYPASSLSREDGSHTRVQLALQAQASAVVMDPFTREVLGLVGGYDYGSNPFNRALQAHRQTGSTFKAFVFSAALDERVITPATLLQDQPMTWPQPGGSPWQPQNADGKFRGTMSARVSLALSRNVTAVDVLNRVGVDRFRTFLETKIGLHTEIPDSLTIALGSPELSSMEMTNAMATFASGGRMGLPILVREVVDGSGQTIFRGDAQLERSLDERVTWLVGSMLRSVVMEGTGRRARQLPFQVVGKTGTTNSLRDAWFTGWSTALVGSVWVGYDSNQSLGRGEGGGTTALPIWMDAMRAAHEGRRPADFPEPPSGVVSRTIAPQTEQLARPGAADGITEYFLAGTEPRVFAPEIPASDAQNVLIGRDVERAAQEIDRIEGGF